MSGRDATVAILTHSSDAFWRQRYLVQAMLARWEAAGLKVAVVTERDPFVPADVALLHVDLSVVPEESRKLAGRYRTVLNGDVLDIRKRRFSRQLADRETPGQVIVKTDLNCGGLREFRRALVTSPVGTLAARIDRREVAAKALARLEAIRPWARRSVLPVGAYRVFRSARDVPEGVWRNPRLVVERFAAEREGTSYCCRHWLFFGTREVHRRTVSPDPVVKASARLEPLAEPVPQPLRDLRAELGFDYGKFDYGLVDGEVVVYDVNRTPGASADARRHTATVDELSQGLLELVRR
jgi:hypothetical protein